MGLRSSVELPTVERSRKMRPIDADALKKNIARLHILNDEAEIRRAYASNPYSTLSDFEDTLVSAFDDIDDAPTIDAVNVEWTPCEERLPSERGEYLVTVTYEGDTYVECLHYGKPTMANREVKGECFYDSDDEWGDVVYDTEAIAWMPLPKPYGEREGE